MKYFNPDFLLFLKEIEANNHKAWFEANKERYKAEVERPFERFTNDLIDALDPLLPDLRVTARDCMFRVYKDTRFSKDKAPYKTHVSALISSRGRKDKTTPGAYIQFSAQDIRLYSGCFELSPKQLEKVRSHMYENLPEFDTLINNRSFTSTFGEIQGEKYKRVALPYADIADQQPLILNKSFYYFKNYRPETALQDDLIELLVQDYKHCSLVNEFFRNALVVD